MDWPSKAFKQVEYLGMWCADHVPGARSLSRAVNDFVSRHPSISVFLVILAFTAFGLYHYEGVTRRCPTCRRKWAGTATGNSSPEVIDSYQTPTRPFVSRTTETSRVTTRYLCRFCGHVWSRSSSSSSNRYDFDPYNP